MDQSREAAEKNPPLVSLPQYGFESEKSREFPGYLIYETVNVCNAKCSHCPQSMIAARPGFQTQRLSWETFEQTIHEAAQYPVDVVRFTG